MLKTILVPTDCSALSGRALRYADRLASRCGGGVLAVYAERFSARLEGEGVAASLAGRDDFEWMCMPVRRSIEAVLESSLSAETPRGIVIADDAPPSAIVSVAERRDADLIVLAIHDRNRLMRAVLGSTTDSVLAETKRPVLVLREHGGHEETPLRNILCPLRDSPSSRAAVAQAASLARLFDAKLTLVAVSDETRREPPEWLSEALGGAEHELHRESLGSEPGKDLVKVADAISTDLLVMGTSHRRFSEGGQTTPAGFVVRAAHCPVLTLTL